MTWRPRKIADWQKRVFLAGVSGGGSAPAADPEQFIVAPGVYINEADTDRQFMVAPGVYVNEAV